MSKNSLQQHSVREEELEDSPSPLHGLIGAVLGRVKRLFSAFADREEEPEVLDVLDVVLSQYPKDLRNRLTSHPKAAQLFEGLEGASMADIAGIMERVQHFCEEQGLSAHATNEPKAEPVRSRGMTVGRNDPCPCGSGHKYKKCCLNKPSSGR
jgi:hypothetical protein